MKIVIDARTMGSKPSGIGIYTFNYIKELMESEHKLILLTDIATSQEMQYMKNHDMEIISYGTSVYRSAQVLKYFDFVRQQLNEIQPELFWEPNILIPKKMSGYRGKIMITIHDLFPITHMKYFGLKYAIYFRHILRKTIKRADVILYDSVETKEGVEKYYPTAKKRKTFVQYVIVPRISKEQDSSQLLPIEETEIGDYFLYVGNMEKRKGVDLLLEAYRAYRQKGGTRFLMLAGKSREKDIDEQIASVVKEDGHIIYHGYISEEEKQKLYQECGCFLFPSRAEGFGIGVLEAMNYYKPVIVSNLSIFREIVGGCISYFSLDGNRDEQVQDLSEKMLYFNQKIDYEKYDEVMKRYEPRELGKQLQSLLELI